MKILFFHGLEGSPHGRKAVYLKDRYEAYTPPLETSALRQLKVASNVDHWGEISSFKIYDATVKPLIQAVEAIRSFKPDIIIGSSFGGAILSRLVSDDIWHGDCIFLASAATSLYNICSLPPSTAIRYWVHGKNDKIIPWEDSVEISKNSNGIIHLIDDDHYLNKLIDFNILGNILLQCKKE